MTAAASKIERETTQLPDELRARTLARFEKHRRAWQKNRSLRTINADFGTCLGVGGLVTVPGRVAVGDTISRDL